MTEKRTSNSGKDHHEDSIAFVNQAWIKDVGEIGRKLGVRPEKGLSSDEAQERSRRFPNRLQAKSKRNTWLILLRQFGSAMIIIMVAAGVLAFSFGQWLEGYAIAVVIVANTLIGFVTEIKAVRSMESLRKMGQTRMRVRRDGGETAVMTGQAALGDIVILEAGDLVPADIRLLKASRVRADESALTGESKPVSKQVEPVQPETPLAERACMLWRGTFLTGGSAEGVVIATGKDTELGKIAHMAETAEDETTPLEKRLDALGARLVWLVVALSGLIAAAGWYTGKPVLLMIETAVALAVAAVPEGLPIVATIALARGMHRMARRQALISRLSAVETLGSTNIICTDKTGTLTENTLTVKNIRLPSGTVEPEQYGETMKAPDNGKGAELRVLLENGVLCNNAALPDKTVEAGGAAPHGEPLEVALLQAGSRAGLRQETLLDDWPEVRQEAFDPELKMMATFHGKGPDLRVAVKGSPEAVLERCIGYGPQNAPAGSWNREKKKWLQASEELAQQGLRVLAHAEKTVSSADAAPYEKLAWLGLTAFEDPPRQSVIPAVRDCRDAGIRVVMVTGDQQATALGIAKALKLAGDEPLRAMQGTEFDNVLHKTEAAAAESLEGIHVFARVTPKQKLDLVGLFQTAGRVTAMTGDGVNDAPALKKADIGVAMGKRGTQVAREAADMVLLDDSFASIVQAIRQGRTIFRNIRKFVIYLVSYTVSEVLALAAAAFAGLLLPILPLQILFLNMVTHVFPALALGVGEEGPEIMREPPRPKQEGVLQKKHWLSIVLYGALIAGCTLFAMEWASRGLGLPERGAQTVSFLTLAFAQMWHVFNMRQPGEGLLKNNVVRNTYVWAALGLCAVLVAGAYAWPVLAGVLKLEPIPLPAWGIVGTMSLAPLAVGQAALLLLEASHAKTQINK